MAYQRERQQQREIALERIRILFEQAGELASSDADASSRRVRQARNISLRCNVRIPREYRLRFCPKCFTYFASGSLRCRLNAVDRRIQLKCLRCGYTSNQPYVKEKE